eukprot:CAMPEP_0115103290 /NCGR_PEP_ID=MMETSP0227-20121206/34494_1 /TAXON_ID=89957 /ORGANISM="Polarella glacialis, Strain CCMP 1383" /LENGTH=212 /DNA_ID=CAMNT_0002499713 /DNA_START=60 /DNA_END=696 /DNA_ORIENTATION=+
MTRTTQRIAQQLSDRLAWTGGLHWDFEAWCVVGNSGGCIVTSETAQASSVCVVRADSDAKLAAALTAAGSPAARSTAPSTAVARARAFGGGSRPAALLVRRVRAERPEVTSTAIRSLLALAAWEELEDLGCLSSEVLHHLRTSREPGDAAEVPADGLPPDDVDCGADMDCGADAPAGPAAVEAPQQMQEDIDFENDSTAEGEERILLLLEAQ